MSESQKSLYKVNQKPFRDEMTEVQHKTGVALLGRTLLVVNPVSQSGQGSKNGRDAYNILRNKFRQNVELVYTEGKKQATEIVQKQKRFDTVLAIGGDGLVHEIVQGLMKLDKKDRPKFGIIPVGSGNDYARTLGMSFNAKTAIEQLINSYITVSDIGKCNDEYFAETLSFGLDAGIALGTEELRKKSGSKGFKLYFQSGVDQILHHLDTYNFEMEIDGKTVKDDCIMFAVQNGVTYGGGFQITPDAKFNDGVLDICYANGGVPIPKALGVFSLASKGKHKNFKMVHFHDGKDIKLKFDGNPPCQIDGEKYEADEFHISIVPAALRVFRFAK